MTKYCTLSIAFEKILIYKNDIKIKKRHQFYRKSLLKEINKLKIDKKFS